MEIMKRTKDKLASHRFSMEKMIQKCSSSLQLMVILIIISGRECGKCPRNCLCHDETVQCRNLGLRSIPKNISGSVTHLDLSNNPLLEFKQNSFMKFKKLHTLILRNCSVSNSFELPGLLKGINLAHNNVNIKHLQATLHNISLNWIDISFNDIKIHNDLSFMPMTISYLRLDGNHIHRLTANLLKHLNELRHLSLNKCDIKIMDSDAFHSHKRLQTLNIENNKIEQLPRNFLIFCYGLSYLFLSNNSFSSVPDLRGPKSLDTVDLSHNENLTLLSNVSFSGVSQIKHLYLHRNNIKNLPQAVFRGMSISSLFLYGNKIQNVNKVFSHMTSPPSLVLLFDNPQLKKFISKEYITLSAKATVYISCNEITEFVGPEKIQARIKCSPAVPYHVKTMYTTLGNQGYDCRKEKDNYICNPCRPGFYGDVQCKACPAGSFYQDEVATTSCKTCSVGQYVPPRRSPGKSALDCLTCPIGTRTDLIAGYRACRCLDGFARTDRFGECMKCETFGISCSKDYKQLKRGFWWIWRDKSNNETTCKKSYKFFTSNLEIESDGYDRNFNKFTCAFPKPHKCPIYNSCLGGVDASCDEKYTGVLCAVCRTGYQSHFNRCTKCPKPVFAVLEFLAYVVFFILLCMLISWTDKVNVKINENCTRTLADIILSNVKIFLGFYQVLSGIIHAFAYIHWPHSMKKAVKIFEFAQLQVLRFPSLRCMKPEWRMNAIHEFWFTIIGTAFVPCTILLFFITKKVYYFTTKERGTYQERCAQTKKNCLRAVALFLFATYPLASQRVIQILPISCHKLCADENCAHVISFLRSDYSVRCLSFSKDILTLSFAYLSLIIPFGLPVILLVILWCVIRKRVSREPVEIEELETFVEIRSENNYLNMNLLEDLTKHESATRFAVKFAYENYNESSWYWEAIEMIRKLLMTAGLTLFLQQTEIGISFAIFTAGVFAVWHAYRHPIRDSFENRLQLFSLCIIPINLCVGAVLKPVNTDNETVLRESDSYVLGILLVFLNSSLAILMVTRFMRAMMKKVKSYLEQRRGHCQHCLACLCPCLHLSGLHTVERTLENVAL